MARQLDALQILRGIAATLVVFDHLVTACLHRLGRLDADLHGLWFAGALGVQIFFCISGFIITQSLLTAGPGQRSVLGFYQRRIIRVVPLYWLATGVFGVWQAIKGQGPTAVDVLRSLLFIPYADAQGQMRPILGLGWSLNFEMFFYLVLGQALWLRSRWGPALIALAVLVPIWLVALWVPASQLRAALPGDTALIVSPVLGYFLAGVALAYLVPSVEQAGLVRWPGVGAVSTGLTAVVAVLVAAVMADVRWLGPAEQAARLFAVGSVLLCALQSGDAPRSGRIIVVARRFGDASYSTYLSHAFVVGSAAGLLAQWPLLHGMAAGGIAALCLLLLPIFNAIGLVLHRWVEVPMMVWCAGWMWTPPVSARQG